LLFVSPVAALLPGSKHRRHHHRRSPVQVLYAGRVLLCSPCHLPTYTKVCVQLSTSADNVALPAYAAARRAAAPLLLTAAPPAVKQSIGIFWPPGSRQQTRSGRRMGETDRQKDTRHPAYYAGSARILCTGHAAGRALDCPVSIPDCFAVLQRP